MSCCLLAAYLVKRKVINRYLSPRCAVPIAVVQIVVVASLVWAHRDHLGQALGKTVEAVQRMSGGVAFDMQRDICRASPA